ncbi:hypothetical protein [Huintestinicola sp.]
MQYTKLGNTDIEVSKLCLGCMPSPLGRRTSCPHGAAGSGNRLEGRRFSASYTNL